MHWKGLYDWWNWRTMAQAWLSQANKSKGCWMLYTADSQWSHFPFQLWSTLLCEGEQNHCSMSPSKYHSCTTKLEPTRKGAMLCWLSSLLSSGCAWILTIQVCLWGGNGGVCIGQWGRNLEGRVSQEDQRPFQKAFTKENIRKAFEMTGTWPVDHYKITATQLAPAKGLKVYPS